MRQVWGLQSTPTSTQVRKESPVEEINEIKPKAKKLKLRPSQEVLTNCRRVEDRILEGKELDLSKFEKLDWDTEMKKYREKLEAEHAVRTERLDRKKEKENAWQLYKICKDFLEENDKKWAQKKKERELEKVRKERLEMARMKQEQLRETIKERNLEKELDSEIRKLPTEEQEKLEKERLEKARERKLELAKMKRNLWKFRNKEKKLFDRSSDRVTRLNNIKSPEEKLEKVKSIAEELK